MLKLATAIKYMQTYAISLLEFGYGILKKIKQNTW